MDQLRVEWAHLAVCDHSPSLLTQQGMQTCRHLVLAEFMWIYLWMHQTHVRLSCIISFQVRVSRMASEGGPSSPISPKRKSRHWRVICPVSLFNRHLCTTYITCHLLLQAQGIQNKVPALRKLTFWWGRPQTNIYIKMCQVVVSAKKMDKVGQGEWLTGWGSFLQVVLEGPAGEVTSEKRPGIYTRQECLRPLDTIITITWHCTCNKY